MNLPFSNPIKVLLVDDDDDDYFLMNDYLQDIRHLTFEVEWASTFQEGISKIDSATEYDIYFFDYLLGAKTGLDLLQHALSRGIDSPIILLTGKGDNKIDEKALQIGAMDYLVKGEIDPEKLDRSIRYALSRTNAHRSALAAQRKAQQEALLAEKSAATTRLIRTLAHEVRNPLTNINLSIEQLESELPDDDLKLFTDIIRRNSRRINDLITTLLNTSRPAEIQLAETSILQILEQTIAEASDRIKLKDIVFTKNFGEDKVFLLDTSQIKIALLNLIVNAIEAMEPSVGKLTISTHLQENKYKIIISDNGCGISKENINRLFEPYFTSKPTGMGLGLAATLSILQAHNAHIEVQSELGRGTTFNITFSF